MRAWYCAEFTAFAIVRSLKFYAGGLNFALLKRLALLEFHANQINLASLGGGI